MFFTIMSMLAEHQPKQHTSQPVNAVHTVIHTAVLSHISNSTLMDLFGALLAGTVAIAFVMSRTSHKKGSDPPYVIVSHSLKEGETEVIRQEEQPTAEIVENKSTTEGHKSTVFYDCLRGPGIFLKRIKAGKAAVITLKLNDTFELCWTKQKTGITKLQTSSNHRYHLSTLLAAFKCDGGLTSGSRFVLQFPTKILCVDSETSEKAEFVVEGLLGLRQELAGRTLTFVHALKRSSSSNSNGSWKSESDAAEADETRAKSSRLNRLVEQVRWTMKRRSSGKEIKVVEPQPRNYVYDDVSWE
jgi:hypothetical protein